MEWIAEVLRPVLAHFACHEGARSKGDRLACLGLSERGEPAVNRLYDDRSFADRRGYPLHRARADVTHGKDAG
jgi:hypothetical protein